MEYSYFPGCTLHQQERVFDISTRATARSLGIELVEPENWQCCGAVFPLAQDELLRLVSPYRTLMMAHEAGLPTTTLCAGCFNVLKRTHSLVERDEEVRDKLGVYTELEWEAGVRIEHFLQVLDGVCDDQFNKARVNDVDVNIACYYGCLLTRPGEQMEFDDCERPQIMDRVLNRAGLETIDFVHRTECCGAYLSAVQQAEDSAVIAADRVISAAISQGADIIAVSCPLCRHNLSLANQRRIDTDIPIVYFTQLLAYVFGAERESDLASVLAREVSCS